MSNRTESLYRLELYRELDDIVSAMKNLAQVELHRVKRAEASQRAAFATTEDALAALRQSVPAQWRDDKPRGRRTLILLGSERGFCGGFNEQILRAFQTYSPGADNVLVIGGRLEAKLPEQSAATFFSSPTTVDEVLPCALQITDHLLMQSLPASLVLLYHHLHAVESASLLPAPAPSAREKIASLQTQIPLETLRAELQWQYLQQGLILYLLVSLQAENRMRLQQMEGAREHLETLIRELRLRINRLRQQEIVEEIEVILAETDCFGKNCTTLNLH